MIRAIVVAAAFLVACSDGTATSGDTCTDGRNMTNPRLVAGIENDAEGSFVRLTWDAGTGRGAELPPAYFTSVRIAPVVRDAGAATAASVAVTAPREIRVRLAQPPRSTQVAFDLRFDDRAKHIDCRHPGMSDEYILSVTLSVDALGVVTNAELAERVNLGDL